MLIIKLDNIPGIFITDLWSDQWDQIRLSILSARESGWQAMKEVAEELHVTMRCYKTNPVMNLKIGEVTDVMLIMANTETGQNERVLLETLEALDCALEMAVRE